jgi:hypothetical protein
MKTLLAALVMFVAVGANAISLDVSVAQTTSTYAINIKVNGGSEDEFWSVYFNGFYDGGTRGSDTTFHGPMDPLDRGLVFGENVALFQSASGETASKSFMLLTPAEVMMVPDGGASIALLCAGLMAMRCLKHIIAA